GAFEGGTSLSGLGAGDDSVQVEHVGLPGCSVLFSRRGTSAVHAPRYDAPPAASAPPRVQPPPAVLPPAQEDREPPTPSTPGPIPARRRRRPSRSPPHVGPNHPR